MKLLNFMQAWLCLHAMSIPLPLFIPKRYKKKHEKAHSYLLKARTARIVHTTPRSHVIHVFEQPGTSKGKILMTHGWMSKTVFMVGIIDALYRDGYSVYAIDFPAHGESKGIRVNWLDSVQAIVEAQKHLGPFDAAVGHSYGGSMHLCAYSLADYFQVTPIEKIALISAPTSISTPMKRAAKMLKLTPESYRLFRQWVRNEHDFDVHRFKFHEIATRGQSEFLVLHGSQDAIISPQESIRFCQNNQNATLCLNPHANHNNILYNTSTYKTLLSFLDKH